MKEKIKKYWCLIIVIIIIGGVFYWFQWRPTQIRKECYLRVESKQGFIQGKIVAESMGKTFFDEDGYKKCLTEHGLEK